MPAYKATKKCVFLKRQNAVGDKHTHTHTDESHLEATYIKLRRCTFLLTMKQNKTIFLFHIGNRNEVYYLLLRPNFLHIRSIWYEPRANEESIVLHRSLANANDVFLVNKCVPWYTMNSVFYIVFLISRFVTTKQKIIFYTSFCLGLRVIRSSNTNYDVKNITLA